MSDDLVHKLEAARQFVSVPWSPAEEDRLLLAMRKRKRARRVRNVALAATLPIAAAAAAFVVWQQASSTHARIEVASTPVVPAAPASAPVASLEVVRLADGSTATSLDEERGLVLVQSAPEHVEFRVERGSARFDVVPSTSRVFRVTSADVEVTVLGTSFTVMREPERVGVTVHRGQVRVHAGSRDHVLRAASTRWFPLTSADAATEASPGSAASAASAAPAQGVAPWQNLARSGDYKRAYGVLSSAGASVADNVEELLLAADTARLSGHPDAALSYLRKITTRHRSDGRAALAAVTAGRLLLNSLGRPVEAAAAFADARRLAPRGPFVEDAMAREVEALSRAGNEALARTRAEQYLRRYPNGRWAKAMRKHVDARELR